MPMKRHLYPPDWEAISRRIRVQRAQGKCECTGECGSDHYTFAHTSSGHLVEDYKCGAPNTEMVVRDGARPERWELHPGCSLCLGGDDECKPIRIVLTVAHLNHDPADCRDENLKAMCQRCHLRLDSKLHQRNAAATRRGRRAVRDLFDPQPAAHPQDTKRPESDGGER